MKDKKILILTKKPLKIGLLKESKIKDICAFLDPSFCTSCHILKNGLTVKEVVKRCQDISHTTIPRLINRQSKRWPNNKTIEALTNVLGEDFKKDLENLKRLKKSLISQLLDVN